MRRLFSSLEDVTVLPWESSEDAALTGVAGTNASSEMMRPATTASTPVRRPSDEAAGLRSTGVRTWGFVS